MDVTEEFKKRGWLEHLIINTLSKDITLITDEVRADPKILTMQLNGVDLDPMHFVKRLEECYSDAVKKEAQEIIDEIKENALGPVEDLIDEMHDTIRDIIDNKLSTLDVIKDESCSET